MLFKELEQDYKKIYLFALIKTRIKSNFHPVAALHSEFRITNIKHLLK
jgi:hypothetical protein